MEGTGVQYDETKITFKEYFGEPGIEISRILYLDIETPNIRGYYNHRQTVYTYIKDIYGEGTPQYEALGKEIARLQELIGTFKDDIRLAERMNVFWYEYRAMLPYH